MTFHKSDRKKRYKIRVCSIESPSFQRAEGGTERDGFLFPASLLEPFVQPGVLPHQKYAENIENKKWN